MALSRGSLISFGLFFACLGARLGRLRRASPHTISSLIASSRHHRQRDTNASKAPSWERAHLFAIIGGNDTLVGPINDCLQEVRDAGQKMCIFFFKSSMEKAT